MKKILCLAVALVLILSLAACGNKTMTMQDVYDAFQLKAMLDTNESIFVQYTTSGMPLMDYYLTEDYAFETAGTWCMLMSKSGCYALEDGVYRRIIYVQPDGLVDMEQYWNSLYASPILAPETVKDEIQSTTVKDQQIIVEAVMRSEDVAEFAALAEGITACSFEYVLDAACTELYKDTGDYLSDDTIYIK